MKTHSIKFLGILLGVFWLMAGCQKDDFATDEPVVDNIAVSARASLKILPAGEYPYGQATSINERGQIVGISYYGEFIHWEGNEMTYLSEGDWTYWIPMHAAINDRGQIAGTMLSDPLGNWHPLFWESNDAALEELAGNYSWALAINNQGKIAGYGGRPVVWENGIPTELPIGTFFGGHANSINIQGHVVGRVDGQPALWRNGELSLLPLGEFSYGNPQSINARMQIVGEVSSTDYLRKPALWENGQLTILPLGEYLSGIAYSINTRGQIVGEVDDKPALWENGQLYILPMDGHDEGVAYCINARGQIVGHVDGLPALWE